MGVSEPKTPLELAALATAAVPGLTVAALREPQYSDESVSVTGLVDREGNRWVVVAPQGEMSGAELEAQLAILRALGRAHDQEKLTFDVPRPAGFARPDHGARVMVHPDLGGSAMTEDQLEDEGLLPASLGRALASLHNLEPDVLADVGAPAYTAEECRARHLAMLDEVAKSRAIPKSLWDRWEGALEDVALWRFATTPIHADLQPSNVVVEQGVVTAVTGFAAAHVGDPAQDLAWLLAEASDGFLKRCADAYQMARGATDLHLLTRAQLLSELAVARWLAHGMHAHDDAVIADARRMLADLAEDVGGEPLVRSLEGGAGGGQSEARDARTKQTASPARPEAKQGGGPARDDAESGSRQRDMARRRGGQPARGGEDAPTEDLSQARERLADAPTTDLSGVVDQVVEHLTEPRDAAGREGGGRPAGDGGTGPA